LAQTPESLALDRDDFATFSPDFATFSPAFATSGSTSPSTRAEIEREFGSGDVRVAGLVRNWHDTRWQA